MTHRLTMTAERRALFARQAIAKFDRHEAAFLPVVKGALDTYLAHVRKALAGKFETKTITASVDAEDDDSGEFTDADAMDIGEFTAELRAAWPAILDSQIMPAYTSMLTGIIAPGLQKADPAVTKMMLAWRETWLDERRQELVGVPDVITSQFRTLLNDLARKVGTSVDDARDAAQTMLDSGYESWAGRAQTIARTEVVGANNQGGLASWSAMASASGRTVTKTWLATEDSRTREAHADIDGTEVGIDDTFDVDGDAMNGPGDPNADAGNVINCRCTLTYAMSDGSELDAEDASALADDADAEDGGDGDGEDLTAAAATSAAGGGVAIMLGINPAQAAAIAAPGVDVPPPGLHCTVAYLAEPSTSYTDEQKAALVSALGQLNPAGTADAFATAQFNPDDPEREPCAVLLVQSDWLSTFHDDLSEALVTAQFDQSTTFPIWIPHVAIAYNADVDVIPAAALTELTFDHLVLGWAGEQIVVAGDGAPDPGVDTGQSSITAASEDNVTAPAAAPPSTAPAADASGATTAPVATGGDTPDLGTDLTPQGQTWSGVLAELGTPSSDGRQLAPTGLIVRPLPLPISWQKESALGHDGKVTVGRVLQCEVRGSQLWGSGDYLDPMVVFDVTTAMGIVEAGLGLVSVDIAPIEMGFVDGEGQPIDPATSMPDVIIENSISYEFGGVTIVDFPAFATARIQNDPIDPADANAAMEDIIMPGTGVQEFATGTPVGATISADGSTVTLPDGTSAAVGDQVTTGTADDGTATTGTITAINPGPATVTVTPDQGASTDPVDVPVSQLESFDPDPKADDADDTALLASSAIQPYRAELFQKRDLPGPTAITVDPTTGAVFGHAAEWGSCHTGKMAETGRCTTPPRAGETGYGYFHRRPIKMDDGSMTLVGKLTVGTGHAVGNAGFRGAVAHYDNTGANIALVRAYEDDYGIQVVGQVVHGADPQKVQELSYSDLSGDWRKMDGKFEMMAALGVNVPGFPVTPAFGFDPTTGEQVALVAAGVVHHQGPRTLNAVTLPSGATIPAADFESLVAGMMETLTRQNAKAAVTGGGEARQLALRKARARLQLA